MDGTYPATAQLSEERERLVAEAAPSVVRVLSGRHRSSGLIWRPGLVVTAEEALAEDAEIQVALPGGEPRPATLVGRDAGTDVALLRVEGLDGAPVSAAGSQPKTGAIILAVGSGASGAVAVFGSVAHAGPAWHSARGGEIDMRLDLDLRLPEVAEGGPAFDASGGWIGMAVFGPRRRVLAIPAATIERVAATLEAEGRVPRGYLGLGLQRIRLDGGGDGLLVASVDPGGPGATAGIHQGDILAAIDGAPIRSVRALLRGLGPAGIGRVLALTVRRGGADHELPLTVGARPER